MNKVSVVIPNYNCAPYISKAIESILTQTYQNFELLICDDGSTDHSKAVLENWQKKDERIKVFFNDGNKGHIYTYNRLFFQAQGDFIMILDADDWAHPQRIEKQLEVIDLFKVDVCLTNFAVYKLDGSIDYKPLSQSGYIDIKGEEPWAPATIFFKRKILEVIPGFNAYFERSTSMDRYFILEVLSVFKGYYLDEYLYNVLERPDSDHRSIDIEDKRVFRKLVAPDIYNVLKKQRRETGTDWLKDRNFEALNAFEQNLIADKKYISELIRGFACRQIDTKRYKPAAQLIKASIKVNPFYLKNYQTLFYYIRSKIS
jgi:glycosyltransferase involved in cell wall biosynthesis